MLKTRNSSIFILLSILLWTALVPSLELHFLAPRLTTFLIQETETPQLPEEDENIPIIDEGQNPVSELINAHPDVFITFERAKALVKELLKNNSFVVAMMDGNRIKKRNHAFDKDVVDQMLIVMVTSLLKIAQSCKNQAHPIPLYIFRRGGDEFGIIIESEGLTPKDIEVLLTSIQLDFPKKLAQQYGLMTIHATGTEKKESLQKIKECLIPLKKRGIVKAIGDIRGWLAVLYQKDQGTELILATKKVNKTIIYKEIQPEVLAMTASVGALAINEIVIRSIEDAKKSVDLETIMAGVHFALKRAKTKPADQNALAMLGIDQTPIDPQKWFHLQNASDQTPFSLFKNPNRKSELSRLLSPETSPLPEDERDHQVPSFYDESSLRRKIEQIPYGFLVIIDSFWSLESFDSVSRNHNGNHKGNSYLKGFYKFNILNTELPGEMDDADWVIRIFGICIQRVIERHASLNERFEIQFARAAPGKSPDRFLIWFNPKEGVLPLDKRLRESLPKILSDIEQEISQEIVLGASLQATVVPVQSPVSLTFMIADELCNLYVDYTNPPDPLENPLKMNAEVAKVMKEATLQPNQQDVIITPENHRIVYYNSSDSQQKTARDQFISLRGEHALTDLETESRSKPSLFDQTPLNSSTVELTMASSL